MKILTQTAYSKINLGLIIGSNRPDGYHNIETIFQRISLSDVVTIFPAKSGVSYFGPKLTESPEHNLSVKAASQFLDLYKIEEGVEVALTKRIPTGAGLGGGSSDAAAVLRILAELYVINVADPRLQKLAISLGADVPFFLNDFSAAIGSGLGEELTPLNGLASEAWILIMWPGFQISTAQAYLEFDNSLTEASRITNLGVRSLSVAPKGENRHYLNDFESTIFSAHPALLEARDKLLQAGAYSAGLAGSGSSLFAIFDGESEARMAAAIQRPQWQSFVCRPF